MGQKIRCFEQKGWGGYSQKGKYEPRLGACSMLYKSALHPVADTDALKILKPDVM